MDSVLLETKSISKKYGDRYVIRDIDLKIGGGQFAVVLGHSGSGKSTMLNILSSILKPTSGHVFYHGKDITQLSKREIAHIRRNRIGFVFQHYMLLSNLTVWENIQIGAGNASVNLDLEELSRSLGLEHLLDQYPHQLSGGEQQRVCIASGVIKKPEILFCDEATGALDRDNSKNIITLLHKIKKEYGTSIIFTTHNREIARTAERILVLEDGRLVNDYANKQIVSPEAMNWEM